MSQLLTLLWLKWTLFRNSMRSSKAVVNQLATVVGMLAALALALVVATGLGAAAYFVTSPTAGEVFRHSVSTAARQSPTVEPATLPKAEFIFFSILAFLYLMWATVPLSIGSSKQFDAGRLLMYPISLGKLFAIDFISELTTLQSVFAIPAILAMGIGAGLGRGNLALGLIAVVPAALFGIAFSKWLSTMIATLFRRKRARGEAVLATVGAVAGLGGAIAGQVAPLVFKHAESLTALRWTPPGAAGFIMAVGSPAEPFTYGLFLLLICGYSILLIFATYWIARRSALGLGGGKQQKALATNANLPAYTGWELPLVSPELSALIEKELRYAMRNAQLRMMALMPLILVVVRFVNSRRFSGVRPRASSQPNAFLTYGMGWIVAAGVLYVFLILAGLAWNQFAFEEGGMRTLILAPVERRRILIGKNIAVVVLALVFSTMLVLINGLVFRDLTLDSILFGALSFVVFASLMAIIGNWFSIRFPKRMQFGKRLNVSGVAGIMLIPMILLLGTPPGLAVFAGYYTHNLVVEYATLALFAALSFGLYLLLINFQGRLLARREIEILEAVREPTDE
ncbi:MAG TPA: hypothetical protein VKB46_03745 [Pyrinomonadaceae bacterium]|nr:hypothetical protein [Pyrinomonadaceae bacterium]